MFLTVNFSHDKPCSFNLFNTALFCLCVTHCRHLIGDILISQCTRYIKGEARLQFKRQSGRVKRRRHISRDAQGAERGEVLEGVSPSPLGKGLERGLDVDPSPESVLFDLKMEHFVAVFKLHLTEK